MSKYKGLFTFDVENHRYLPVEQADGIIAELNAEWEDCTPKEPLIKDEKIRKAVRVWAEANHVTRVKYDASWNSFRCTDFVIGFDYDFDRHDGLEDEESYTITELCGEEEE